MMAAVQHAALEAGPQGVMLQAALLTGCTPLMQHLLDVDRAAG